jgi:hypothetical protein
VAGVFGVLEHLKIYDILMAQKSDFCCDQDLHLLHQESKILECSQDLENLEVSRTKVGSLRK